MSAILKKIQPIKPTKDVGSAARIAPYMERVNRAMCNKIIADHEARCKAIATSHHKKQATK